MPPGGSAYWRWPPLWILSHQDLRATVRMRALRDVVADAVTAKRDRIEGRRR